jgi:hypothetical protein
LPNSIDQESFETPISGTGSVRPAVYSTMCSVTR